MSDRFSPGGVDRSRLNEGLTRGTAETGPRGGAETAERELTPNAAAVSPAVARFRSCRWRRPPEDNGGVECCGHRDVLPLAGTASFDAEAWCPDCTFYKLRRTPKKRTDY